MDTDKAEHARLFQLARDFLGETAPAWQVKNLGLLFILEVHKARYDAVLKEANALTQYRIQQSTLANA